MMQLPPLETERLLIRSFVMDDLDEIHRLLDIDLGNADFGSEAAKTLNERKRWLQWTIISYEELAKLYQPPYGDRAVVLKETGRLIGACGFVPCLGPFGQLPSNRPTAADTPTRLSTPEVGLFYAISPAYQKQGYATEAARTMIAYAFEQLKLKRIVATTTFDNAASLAVMHKLGMRIERNPYPDPPWFQVVGVLENDSS